MKDFHWQSIKDPTPHPLCQAKAEEVFKTNFLAAHQQGMEDGQPADIAFKEVKTRRRKFNLKRAIAELDKVVVMRVSQEFSCDKQGRVHRHVLIEDVLVDPPSAAFVPFFLQWSEFEVKL